MLLFCGLLLVLLLVLLALVVVVVVVVVLLLLLLLLFLLLIAAVISKCGSPRLGMFASACVADAHPGPRDTSLGLAPLLLVQTTGWTTTAFPQGTFGALLCGGGGRRAFVA